ncbi:MAG: L-rhamnose mutarotase [Bacteroidales bacterium]|nr:L-rhamnose mutarotase [Bacteroidales bacterium]
MNGYEKNCRHTRFRRFCKVLTLNDNKDLIEKYKEVHRPGAVWPEITKGIREVGIIDMEIYLHGNIAFMIMDTVPDFDHDKAMKELAQKPGQKEWEQYVSQFQKAGDKSDTPEKWEITERIFELDKQA